MGQEEEEAQPLPVDLRHPRQQDYSQEHPRQQRFLPSP